LEVPALIVDMTSEVLDSLEPTSPPAASPAARPADIVDPPQSAVVLGSNATGTAVLASPGPAGPEQTAVIEQSSSASADPHGVPAAQVPVPAPSSPLGMQAELPARQPQPQQQHLATRQNLPGTPAASLWKWPPRHPSNPGAGPLAIPEYIQDLIRQDSSDIERIYELPSAEVDPLVWQYEHLRQFVIEFNLLLVALGDECIPETCPKMTASNEWQYLCAAHRKPQDCAAIDYMMHTIDGSTALLANAKHFALRTEVPPANAKYFQSMARRLYRIFAHVFYHHRQIFDDIEAEIHLCARFSHFVMKFKLMSPSMLLVPPEAYDPRPATS